ncbi:hypothetical protein DPEC_G00146300 [Dallia pectoralis]|uniref:Uncharacterized protein n=1 Tax=Dallia pectoralis TaxID=75939 RepID=A0ACC2GPH8_DALPE|nr:hypothetical protein DPEC_G00146300 [Dallia pectoralis]
MQQNWTLGEPLGQPSCNLCEGPPGGPLTFGGLMEELLLAGGHGEVEETVYCQVFSPSLPVPSLVNARPAPRSWTPVPIPSPVSGPPPAQTPHPAPGAPPSPASSVF